MRKAFQVFLILLGLQLPAQDMGYTREVIRTLCSKKFYGRGYLKNGLHHANAFIQQELKKSQAQPLPGRSWTQPFTQTVNTFPGPVNVCLNGKSLVAGVDFIPDPASGSYKGTARMFKKDSLTYQNEQGTVVLQLKKKLTFSVEDQTKAACVIELDRNRVLETPVDLKVDLKSKLNKKFKAENIVCQINGKSRSDSLMVFTAHYDHLGGLGKEAWFPGANDNASGVSMLLSLAKYYSEHAPRYNTVFIFFAGEEAGLLGSAYFVQHAWIDLSKIKFLINMDLLGTGDDGVMVVNGAVHEKEFARLQQINSEKNYVKEVRKRGKAANSDHYLFSEAGVPCFFIYTLGGTAAYHDVQDKAEQLPLTDYADVFKLVVDFVETF